MIPFLILCAVVCAGISISSTDREDQVWFAFGSLLWALMAVFVSRL
jgi:hypothetical protein